MYLADQKLAVSAPRVRDGRSDTEVALSTLKTLQQPRAADEGLLLRVLHGLSTRNYRQCAEAVPEAFGLSSSSVSRRFIQATQAKLESFQQRSLLGLDLVALFIDGKSFADQQMVIALGITLDGRKIPLGFIQTATENERACSPFLGQRIDRGLDHHAGLLVLIDGAKGLHAAVERTFGPYACIQRCQWHKRENVLSYLPKSQQASMRHQLQHAYDLPTYAQAKAALGRLHAQLDKINPSAAASLVEGLEETLTLHRLGMMPALKASFRTTHSLESLNSLVAQRVDHVKRWTTGKQRHRWLAAALIDIQPRLRRVKGHQHLQLLRTRLQEHLHLAAEHAA